MTTRVRRALWALAGVATVAAAVWIGMCVVVGLRTPSGDICGSAFDNRAGTWRHLGGEQHLTQALWDRNECRVAAVARFHAAYGWSALGALGGGLVGAAYGAAPKRHGDRLRPE